MFHIYKFFGEMFYQMMIAPSPRTEIFQGMFDQYKLPLKKFDTIINVNTKSVLPMLLMLLLVLVCC